MIENAIIVTKTVIVTVGEPEAHRRIPKPAAAAGSTEMTEDEVLDQLRTNRRSEKRSTEETVERVGPLSHLLPEAKTHHAQPLPQTPHPLLNRINRLHPSPIDMVKQG